MTYTSRQISQIISLRNILNSYSQENAAGNN